MPSLPAGYRLRQRTDYFQPFTATYSDSVFGSQSYSWHPMWTYWESLMDYPNGSYAGYTLNKGDVRPVYHMSIRIKNAQGIGGYAGGFGYITPTNNWGAVTPAIAGELLAPQISESVWKDLSIEAFNRFTDQFPEEIGLGNFLLEIKDLAALIPKLEKSISQTVSGGFLNYKFNIEPTMRDLTTLINLVPILRYRIDYLRRTWGIPHRISFVRRNVIQPRTTNIWYDQGAGGYGVMFVPVKQESVFRANAHLLQRLDHLNDFYGLLRAFMGTTGLNNPLKVAWNAIPFSFVADWFVNVSGHLDRFRVQGATGQWDLKGLTASMTLEHTYKAYQVLRTTSTITRELGTYEVKQFTRLKELPLNALALPAIGSLNPTQLALMLAMGNSASRA